MTDQEMTIDQLDHVCGATESKQSDNAEGARDHGVAVRDSIKKMFDQISEMNRSIRF